MSITRAFLAGALTLSVAATVGILIAFYPRNDPRETEAGFVQASAERAAILAEVAGIHTETAAVMASLLKTQALMVAIDQGLASGSGWQKRTSETLADHGTRIERVERCACGRTP
jgi:hypothetical protein